MPQQTFLNGSALSTVRERLNANAEDAEERLSELVSRVGVVESAVDAVEAAVDGKQDELVSGTSIKTVNGNSLLGSGDIAVQAALVSGTSIKTVNGNSLLGSGDVAISGGFSEALLGSSVIHGLGLSNNVADATNDIDITAGSASVFNGTTWKVVSYQGGTKRLDASWVVGNNEGGLDTGSKANSTWYYVWLIHRSDTGVVDVLLSASPTTPTMPTNYTFARMIGEVLTNSSGVVRSFVQVGDRFLFNGDALTDLNTSSPSTSPTLLAVSVPRIAGTVMLGYGYLTAAGTTNYIAIDSGNTNTSGSSNSEALILGAVSSSTISFAAPFSVSVDSSGRIRYYTAVSSGLTVIRTRGWVSRRGRV